MSTTHAEPVERPAAAAHSLLCRCGQELDLCHGEHCPRCGAAVSRVTHLSGR